MVLGGCRSMVLGGFRSFHVLVYAIVVLQRLAHSYVQENSVR